MERGQANEWRVATLRQRVLNTVAAMIVAMPTVLTVGVERGVRTADPPTARRLPDTSRRGGGCFRCRPRVREGRIRYPELVTKIAPVMQLRALVVRNILHDTIRKTTHG